VLRRVFEPKREEMTGGWRRLHNEELHKEDEIDGTCSPHGKDVKCIKYWLGNYKAKNYWEVLKVDGKITLKWISGKY